MNVTERIEAYNDGYHSGHLERTRRGRSHGMTTKHTPGPWANNGGQIEGLGGYPYVVATVGTANAQTHQDTANARLIAAAPALLEALEQALSSPICPCCGRDNTGYGGCTSDDCPGRAAIKQAKGA